MKLQHNFPVLIAVLSSFQQCISFEYDPSRSYSYSYETDVLINDANSKQTSKPQQDVGVKLSITFQLSTLYKDPEVQLFKLEITKASAHSVSRPDLIKELAGTLTLPAYFQVTGDEVDRLHFVSKDTTFSRNVKKGIVALFQVKETEGERNEVDVSGECKVTYTIPTPGEITRVRSDCQNLQIAGQFSTANKAMGVSVWSKATHKYIMKDNIIDSVSGTHRTVTYLNVRSALNTAATASQSLQFQTSSVVSSPFQASNIAEGLEKAATDANSALDVSLLPSEEEAQQCKQGCESPKTLVAKLAEDLKQENVATVKSAQAFVRMLQSFRASGKKTLSETFVLPESYLIIPQLIDIATAAQTEASSAAIFDLLTFDDAENIDHPQRYLFAAAFSSHPSTAQIKKMMEVLKQSIPSADLRQSLLLSLGAVVNTFCQIPENCREQEVDEFKQMMIDGLAACTDEVCKLMYVRALGNAGLSSTIFAILPYVESPSNPMLASTAIGAFRRMNKNILNQQAKDVLLRVYHQNSAKYDSSVRVAALDVLLDLNPSAQMVRNILLSCLDQSNIEFTTYVMRNLLDTATINLQFRDILQSVLSERYFNNYNIMSQRGKSSVITSFLARMKDVNSTYNLYFENAPSGVMKQSGMIINLVGKTIRQPLMKFGIYANGLESLVGDQVPEGQEGIEPTSGMSFTFMDVLLTQVEFFRGSSGLMSAVWSAPSEMTSALQANLLLQDHSQRVHLTNGLVLDSQVRGVLSMDLSGLVSISLWNRNCESLIRTSGALYLEGSLKLLSKSLNVGMTYTGETQSNIDFTSNADFYEMPLKLCMQMKKPELQFVQTIQKYEKILRSKKLKTKTKRLNKIMGESYFLNKANSAMCKVMLKDAE